MKYLIITVLLLAAFQCSKAQRPYAVFNHIAIYVKDLNRSVTFYSKIFLLDSISDPFPNRKITWFSIGGHKQLHIIQTIRDTIIPQDTYHFCFSVPSVEDFTKVLDMEHIAYTDGNGKENVINTRPDGIKQIWLKDPDGYIVEINDEHF